MKAGYVVITNGPKVVAVHVTGLPTRPTKAQAQQVIDSIVSALRAEGDPKTERPLVTRPRGVYKLGDVEHRDFDELVMLVYGCATVRRIPL